MSDKKISNVSATKLVKFISHILREKFQSFFSKKKDRKKNLYIFFWSPIERALIWHRALNTENTVSVLSNLYSTHNHCFLINLQSLHESYLQQCLRSHYYTNQGRFKTSNHSLSHELGSESESGASKRANRRTSGPVLISRSLAVLNHCGSITVKLAEPWSLHSKRFYPRQLLLCNKYKYSNNINNDADDDDDGEDDDDDDDDDKCKRTRTMETSNIWCSLVHKLLSFVLLNPWSVSLRLLFNPFGKANATWYVFVRGLVCPSVDPGTRLFP